MPAKKPQFNYKMLWVTRRKLVYTVGLVAVGLGIIALAIYPQVQQAIALNAQYQKQSPTLTKLKAKLADLQSIDSTEEYTQAHIVNSALPSRKPLLEFLTSLNSISVKNNISVTDFELTPGNISTDSADTNSRTKTKNTVESMELDLEIEGSFDELQQFLLDIERISPFTTITQLSLGRGASAADRGTEKLIKASLSTSTYFFTQSIKATVDAPLPQLTALDRNVLTALSQFQDHGLPEQTEIVGGGIQDPFGVDKLQILNQFEQQLSTEDFQALQDEIETTETETVDETSDTETQTEQAETTPTTGDEVDAPGTL